MKELTLIEPINDGDDEKINHENDEEEINADSYDVESGMNASRDGLINTFDQKAEEWRQS